LYGWLGIVKPVTRGLFKALYYMFHVKCPCCDKEFDGISKEHIRDILGKHLLDNHRDYLRDNLLQRKIGGVKCLKCRRRLTEEITLELCCPYCGYNLSKWITNLAAGWTLNKK